MVEKFDPNKLNHCEPLLRLVHEPWASIPIAKVFGLMLVTKEIFSYRQIAVMAGVSLGSVAKSIKILVENKYIAGSGGCYFATLGGVHGGEQSVHGNEHSSAQVFTAVNGSVHGGEHTNIYIKNKNKKKAEEEEDRGKEGIGLEGTSSLLATSEASTGSSLQISELITLVNKYTEEGRSEPRLSPAKLKEFLAKGYQEIQTNVFMAEAKYDQLIKEFGQDNALAGIMDAYRWSINEDPQKDHPKRKCFQSWHDKTDHYKTIRNLILRALASEKKARRGFEGYEFCWENRE